MLAAVVWMCTLALPSPAVSQVQPLPAGDTSRYLYIYSGSGSGALRRSMDAARSFSTGFRSAGSTDVGQWNLRAAFDYERRNEYDKRFAGIAEPYSGNPYVWGDTAAGDWQADQVQARVSLHSPAAGRHRFGVQVEYQTGIGARSNRPKPFFRIREYQVAPVYYYRPGRKQHLQLSVSPRLTGVFEENEVGYESEGNSYLIRSRGYGAFEAGSVVSMERRRKGYAGRLQLGLDRPAKWGLQVTPGIRHETVDDGLAYPVKDGKYTLMEIGASAYLQAGSFYLSFTSGVQNRYGDSYFYSSTQEQSYYLTNAFANRGFADISVRKNHNRRAGLQFMTVLAGFETGYQEDQFVGSAYTVHRAHIGLSAGGTRQRLRWDAGVGFRKNLNAIRRVAAPSLLTDLLFDPDFHYAANDLLFWSAKPKYRLSAGARYRWWVGLDHHARWTGKAFRQHSYLQFGIDF